MRAKHLIYFVLAFNASAIGGEGLFTAPELKEYLQNMIERKLQLDVAETLEERGLRSDQIEEVLLSSEFNSFIQNVLKDPQVGRVVNQVVEFQTDPEIRRQVFEKSQLKSNAMREEEWAKLIHNARIHSQSSFVSKTSEKPLLTRVWEKIKTFFNTELLEYS